MRLRVHRILDPRFREDDNSADVSGDDQISDNQKEKCEAALAVEALDPGAPTKVGGHRVTRSTDLVRDSSREDR